MEQDIVALQAAVARIGTDIQAVVTLLSAPNPSIEAATAALTTAAVSLEAVSKAPVTTPPA